VSETGTGQGQTISRVSLICRLSRPDVNLRNSSALGSAATVELMSMPRKSLTEVILVRC
jgi:hypothetical protein